MGREGWGERGGKEARGKVLGGWGGRGGEGEGGSGGRKKLGRPGARADSYLALPRKDLGCGTVTYGGVAGPPPEPHGHPCRATMHGATVL